MNRQVRKLLRQLHTGVSVSREIEASCETRLSQKSAASNRMRKAGVPEEIGFKTKPEIALDQIHAACKSGLPRGVVLMDAGYGANTRLRTDIWALGLTYVAGILPNSTVWAKGTQAAHYLYDFIEVTFVTETERFRAGTLYAELHTTERRSGTNSFQIGLAHGLVRKLDAIRREREAAMIRSSGRDLVPIKASVVDEELARLGIRFHTRERNGGRTVLSDAYHAGQEAGQRFEVRHGIEDGRRRRRPRR